MAGGVEVRGQRMRVYFRFGGVLRREPLDLEPTPANIAYAERLVELIHHEIRVGTFDYSHYFPRSSFLEEGRLGTWLDLWLEVKGRQVAASTLRGYRSIAENQIRPHLGERQADRLDAVDVERWIAEDLGALSSKTIREALGVLRQVYRLYRSRHRGAHDPTDGVVVRLPDREEPDPFTREEIARIEGTPTHREQELRLIRFMIWTGARVSEAIALAWEDVEDLPRGRVHFRRSKVRGKYRATKTRRSDRVVELLRPAREALEGQWVVTGSLDAEPVDVVGRDNRTTRREHLRFIFHNSNTGRAFFDDFRLRDRFFRAHLVRAGVRYRGPGQCRHTFASQMLSAGAPLEWIIAQMGHTSERMFREHYAKWINADAADTLGRVERLLGL